MRIQMKLATIVAIISIGLGFAIAQPAKSDTNIVPDKKVNLFSEESNPDAFCLALNIYHEARGDNLAGKFAVADVVLNRVQDRRYPASVCEVVYQGKTKPSWKDPSVDVMVRNMCQFSWYCDGKPDEPTDKDEWRVSQEIAYKILIYGEYRGISEGATHYHATYVDPTWNRKMQQVGRIGSHLFFRAP